MNKKSRFKYASIWQRVEGDWLRYVCHACKSVTFIVLAEDGPFVHVQCAAGHLGQVLAGFSLTKPDG